MAIASSSPFSGSTPRLNTLVTLSLGCNVSPSRDLTGHGYTVPQDAIREFIRDVVSVAFGAGYTVLKADGGWRDQISGATITEPSLLIQVAVSGSDLDYCIEFVAKAWKQDFSSMTIASSALNASLAAYDAYEAAATTTPLDRGILYRAWEDYCAAYKAEMDAIAALDADLEEIKGQLLGGSDEVMVTRTPLTSVEFI